MSTTRPLVAGVLLPLAVVAGAALPWVLRGADLPDPVPTHWSLGGGPTATARPWPPPCR